MSYKGKAISKDSIDIYLKDLSKEIKKCVYNAT